jgi:hypothetical protein
MRGARGIAKTGDAIFLEDIFSTHDIFTTNALRLTLGSAGTLCEMGLA